MYSRYRYRYLPPRTGALRTWYGTSHVLAWTRHPQVPARGQTLPRDPSATPILSPRPIAQSGPPSGRPPKDLSPNHTHALPPDATGHFPGPTHSYASTPLSHLAGPPPCNQTSPPPHARTYTSLLREGNASARPPPLLCMYANADCLPHLTIPTIRSPYLRRSEGPIFASSRAAAPAPIHNATPPY